MEAAILGPSYCLMVIDVAIDLQLSMTPRCLPRPQQKQLFGMLEVEMVSPSEQVLYIHALEKLAKIELGRSGTTWADDLPENCIAQPGRSYSLHALGVEVAAEVAAAAETLNQMGKP